MLAQHLDQSHGAASRRLPEIRAQVQRLTEWLGLAPGMHLLDVTCGPGLYAAEFACQGVHVTGIDFGPASLEYATKLCADLPCEFVFGDVRQMDFAGPSFRRGDLSLRPIHRPQPAESVDVFGRIRAVLKPGGRVRAGDLER